MLQPLFVAHEDREDSVCWHANDPDASAGARGLPEDTKVRSSKYLNNLVEQDHRNIKSRTNVMLGFKQFMNAAITLAGVELMHRVRKGQFSLTQLRRKDITVPAVWNTVLSAQ